MTMNDIQQNPTPAKPSRPNPAQQTLRVPVTRLVNPQPRKPFERQAPPEEPTLEPWEDDAPAQEAADEERAEPRAAVAPPERRLNGSRPLEKPALGTRPAAGPARSTPASAPAARPALRAPLPRMEMKPVVPSDPDHAGINVAPAPRVAAPSPRASQMLSLRDGDKPARENPEPPARFTPLPRELVREPVSQAPELDETGPLEPDADSPTEQAQALGAIREPELEQAQAIELDQEPEPGLELAQLLERLVNLPAQTAILGVCDDRLPVLLDLADPAPGAVLVASDDEALRTRLLKTVIQTAAALNSPRSVQFLVLSACPDEWQRWLEGLDAARHCLGVDSLVEGSPERWLLKLSGWADQRRTGSSSGPAVILIVDDLAAVPQLEYDARVNFDWLLKEGPGAGIWPVVGLPVSEAPNLVRWVRLFKTRLLGPAADPTLYRQLAALDAQESASLVQPAQFAVRIQENWLKFRLPILPGESA